MRVRERGVKERTSVVLVSAALGRDCGLTDERNAGAKMDLDEVSEHRKCRQSHGQNFSKTTGAR